MRLSELEKGRVATVLKVNGDDASMEAKLREVGFAENDEVEVLHLGPIGKTPLCVRLNQTLIALRLDEAARIEVGPSQ